MFLPSILPSVIAVACFSKINFINEQRICLVRLFRGRETVNVGRKDGSFSLFLGKRHVWQLCLKRIIDMRGVHAGH